MIESSLLWRAALSPGASAPPPEPANIEFVGSKITTFAGFTGTQNIALNDLKDSANANAVLQENDFLIACYAVNPGSNTNLTLGAPSGWTPRQDLYQSGTIGANMAIWHKRMGASPDTSFDVDASASLRNVAVAIMAFRNVDIASPFDVADAVSGAAATANADPPAITPSTDGAWIVCAGSGVVRNISSIFGPYIQSGDLSSATNEFRTASRDIDGSDAGIVLGMGIKKDWVSGAFNPGAWTNASAHSSSAYLACSMALRPAT